MPNIIFKNMGLFLYFSSFFLQFLEFPSVKICTGEDIEMTVIPYFLNSKFYLYLWAFFYARDILFPDYQLISRQIS